MISASERKKLHALRNEAASAGDVSMVETCNSALRGSMVALGNCRRAMAEADARAASPKRRAKAKRKRDDC